MNKKNTIFVLIVLSISLILGISIYSKPIKASNSSYTDFEKTYIKILNQFANDTFMLASKDVESRIIAVFPEGLQLEKRKTLCFEDNQEKPSKFEIFFKDKEDTVLIKLNLIFTPGNSNKGIVFYQVLSPEDNINLEDNYKTIPRPIMVETYESFGDFGVVTTVLSIDSDPKKGIEEKTMNTISKNWDFVKELERFLINQKLSN